MAKINKVTVTRQLFQAGQAPLTIVNRIEFRRPIRDVMWDDEGGWFYQIDRENWVAEHYYTRHRENDKLRADAREEEK